MRHKWYLRYIQVGWLLLLAAVLLIQFITPAGATSKARTQQEVAERTHSDTAINATIYLARGYLASMFQSNIDTAIPVAFNNAIMSLISKLPRQDQGWALAMAETLIQPSASLQSLAPQPGGLAMSLLLSLYPGDPKAITSDMLITFNVLDSSHAQVSAQPLNGSPALVSGPLTTFQLPLGQLNSISSTPGCGDAALALNLQFPVSIGAAQGQVQAQALPRVQAQNSALKSGVQPRTANDSANTTNAYIEIPASSLADLSNSIGNLPVGNGLTAQNIRIGVQGSDLTITSDIYWNGIQLGSAQTTVAPTASGGNLVVHVISTTFTVLWIFTFPMNSYNAQIEQTLNAKLGNALAGKFNVTAAGIGPTGALPCAASDSLVLAGSANIGA